jgi:predicted aspartyl protease
MAAEVIPMKFRRQGFEAMVLGCLTVEVLAPQLQAQSLPQLGRECALAMLSENHRNTKEENLGNAPPHESPREAIPFHLDGGFLILVDGRIGPLAPLRFVLDTGATHTVIDRAIAERLFLPRQEGKRTVLNFDKEVELEETNLPDLQVGPLDVRDVPAMVADLKQFSQYAEGVDAVVGLDLLRSSESMQIDYLRNLVTFRLSDGRQNDRRLPVALTVKIPAQGQWVRLIVDTGLDGLLLYQDRVEKHLPQLKLSENSAASAGRLKGQMATLSGIELGPDFERSSVLLLRGAPRSLPSDIDGYLGMNSLHARFIELDFRSNTLRWQ